MIYKFKCGRHGEKPLYFEVKQPMLSEHTAKCPECGVTAQRIYSKPQWIWANSVYRPDGSLRQDSDYAMLKG